MHILIIPSEEFVPAESPTAGIFQYHQGSILQQAGYNVGVISIRQSFSIPMILKAMFFKILNRKVNNATDQHSFFGLMGLAYKKMFNLTPFIREEQNEGIQVIRVDGFYYWPPVENENHFGWIKAGLAAFETYEKRHGKPEVIHAHNAIYAGMLAQKIKEKFGIPYIITEHSTVFARKIIKKKSTLQRINEAYLHSEALTGVSQPFCDLLNRTFSTDRFKCLPNVLDPYLESKSMRLHSQERGEFVFLNIAELHPKKDHLTLIKAFRKVHAAHPNARLWIGGNGKLEEELKNFVAKEQLQNVVRFLGLLNRDEVFNTLHQSDCFVLSSKYETFGVVVIEAILLGKPVIVTRCGGPESFVIPSTGVVIDKENEEQMENAMLIMIKTINNYHPDQIRNYALDQFGAKSFLKRVDTLYRESVS